MIETVQIRPGIYIPRALRFLFPRKEKTLRIRARNKFVYLAIQNKLTLTVINWATQSMFGMHYSDRIGKMCVDVFFTSLVLILFGVGGWQCWIIAFVVAHTINWIFNSNIWAGPGRFLGITRITPSCLSDQLCRLVKRFQKFDCIIGVIVIGSLSRERRFRETSDIDMFIIRKVGMRNAFASVLLTIFERARAALTKFPLDLYLYDEVEGMLRHRSDEIPYVMKDTTGKVRQFYYDQQRSIYVMDDFLKCQGQ